MDEDTLPKQPANYVPLTPVSFLDRSARIYGAQPAIVHGARRYSYAEFKDRCRRLASALSGIGVGTGDTVAILAPNIPEMLEAHYAVPMLGAVLCTVNTAWMRRASASSCAIPARASSWPTANGRPSRPAPWPISVQRRVSSGSRTARPTQESPSGRRLRAIPRRRAIRAFRRPGITDEWQAIGVSYTSGTDRRPEGRRRPPSRRLSERVRQRAGVGIVRRAASISGRCRCFTATAGPTPGQSRSRAARMFAFAGSRRARSSMRSPSMALPISAARRSCSTCSSMPPPPSGARCRGGSGR